MVSRNITLSPAFTCSTLDYYDYATVTYRRDIYTEANPDVPKELGDVGNDLQLYGARLYAVINCSNKIEVMSASTCRRIGQVDIPADGVAARNNEMLLGGQTGLSQQLSEAIVRITTIITT